MNENKDSKLDKTGEKEPRKMSPLQAQEPKKTPVFVFVWLGIFIAIAVIFVIFQSGQKIEKWSQTKFEEHLKNHSVINLESSHLTDNTYIIDGKFKEVKDDGELKERLFETKVDMTERLDKLISISGAERVNKPKNQWIAMLITTLLPVLIVVGVLYFLLSRQMKSAGKGAMQFGKSRARMLVNEDQKTTFDDIAGAEEAKEETKELVDYLQDPLKFKLLGAKIPKGALLIGPPGTGKTLLAKAIASEANVPFFTISGSDFVEMFVGVGASRVRDMFEQAKKHAPCLIFIDEIDAVGRSRFTGIGGGHDEREQTLNALLVEMDGMESQEGIIILAATNRPDVLDPALTRPGRLDRQIVLDFPDKNGRHQILKVHAKKIKMAEKIDLEIIAKGTPGFSGADLANLINEAALLAARHNKTETEMEDFEEAKDKVRWGRERRSRKIGEEDRKITAYHEAGHTLVAINMEMATPVHKVTIIPRGIAYLGATMHLPEEDRYTRKKSEYLAELAVLMGGRVAEELIFKDITSGASGDIEQATKIAKSMVCAFGMSEDLGCVQYGNREEHIFIGRDITRSEDFSEETAREIDLEIKKLINDAYEQATKILHEQKDKLELLSQTLLEKEVLDLKQIQELLGIEQTEKKTSENVNATSDKA